MKPIEDFNKFLSDTVNIDESRIDRLNTHVDAVSTYLSRNLEGYVKIERQGSYALRTLIKPLEGREYDADLLLFMKFVPGREPADYIADVYRCLRESGTYAEMVHRKTRCAYLDYSGDFHLDIVPCIIEVGGQRYVCNRDTNKFEPTDGTGYRDWFNKKNSVTNGNLKRVTRLLKYMRDHKGNFTAPSILLTTLIGDAVYDFEDDTNFKNVPDSLLTVCGRVNDFLQANAEQPEIRNPVLPEETFTRHWDAAKYRNFREKFDVYTRDVADARSETDPEKSTQKWRRLFGDDFGKSGNGGGDGASKRAAVGGVVRPGKPYAR